MNNEKLNPVLKALVKQHIEQQVNILKFTTRKDLTLSIPKIDDFTEEDIKSIVMEVMSDTHEIIYSQSLRRPSTNDVILITLKLK